MFTIEVKKREKDEEFGFGDLEMFHRECYGGRVAFNDNLGSFECRRCNASAKIGGWMEKWTGERTGGIERRKLKVVLTAIDGEERQLGSSVRVVQKT